MTEMTIEEARGLAAQCWCEPETSDREMDPPLAEAFAKKLQAAAAQARAEERESCAEIALAIDSGRGNEKEIAAAIRARSTD